MIELNEPQERKQFINSNEIGIRNEVLLVEVRLLLVMLTSLPVIKLLNCSLEREMEFLFLLCLSLSLPLFLFYLKAPILVPQVKNCLKDEVTDLISLDV